jgi:hypothetical protein
MQESAGRDLKHLDTTAGTVLALALTLFYEALSKGSEETADA